MYAQRVNSNGVIQWAVNGYAVCTADGNQLYPELVSDGSGGAIIIWTDTRSGNSDIYAQRVNSSGTAQWTVNGVAICTATGEQVSPMLISDGSGGAIIAWRDARSGTNDIYAQRVNSSGTAQWTVNGVVICSATSEQYDSRMSSDNAGGAIVTWYDYRNLADGNIYAQRINSSGAVQWTANGIAICTQSPANQQTPRITSDGSNGAIITWVDPRNDGNGDIYAQKINGSGTVQWTTNGVGVCTASNNQARMEILGDGNGGATIIWDDDLAANIGAQKLNSSGVAQWESNGIWVCNASGSQHRGHLVSDGSGNLIVVWDDDRNGSLNIYAQKIGDNPTISSIFPNTANNSGTVNITNLAGNNFSSFQTICLSKSGQTNIGATNTTAVSNTQITCSFDLTGKYLGQWNVVLADTDTNSVTLINGFTITPSGPTGMPSKPMCTGSSIITISWSVGTTCGKSRINRIAR